MKIVIELSERNYGFEREMRPDQPPAPKRKYGFRHKMGLDRARNNFELPMVMYVFMLNPMVGTVF